MKRIVAAFILVALTGCGAKAATSTPAASTPKVSAAASCGDFAKWYLASNQGQNPSAASTGDLAQAAQLAPSGQLYTDMSALLTFVRQGSSIGDPSTFLMVVVTDASQVAQDCSAVNPNG